MYRVRVRTAQACEGDVKRRLLIIAICLLLGAAVNVAVAWGCAGWLDTPGGSRFFASPSRGDPWPCAVPADWPRRAEFGMAEKGLGQTVVVRWTYAARGQRDASVHSRLYGWPLRSLSVHTLYRAFATSTVHAVPSPWHDRCTHCGVALLDSSRCASCNLVNVVRIGAHHRPVPIGVILPGFALNTLFYAAILWLLIAGPFGLRRLLRVRRGLCPKCAYPMGESAVCSECGRELPRTT